MTSMIQYSRQSSVGLAALRLDRPPQTDDALKVPDDLAASKLALAKQSVDKGDGHLTDLVPLGERADHHLHLEDVPFGRARGDHVSQHFLPVQPGVALAGGCVPRTGKIDSPERTRQVGDAWPEEGVGKEVCTTADELAVQVPAVHAARPQTDPHVRWWCG